MRARTGISERRACGLIGLSRTVLHYAVRPCARREALRARLVSLAAERRRFGSRRLHALLRREGEQANVKCVYRVSRQEQLQVQRRRRRQGVAVERRPLAIPDRPNQV
jgi:putative transposase